MKKLTSISPRFDEQIRSLQKDGFAAFYKARGMVVSDRPLNIQAVIPHERIEIDDKSIKLQKDEYWFPVYWNGKNYVTVHFHPDGFKIPQGKIVLHFTAPTNIYLSGDSKDFLDYQIYWHEARSQNVIAKFTASNGQEIEVQTHRKHLENIPEFQERKAGTGWSASPIKGAGEAMEASRSLKFAIAQLQSEKEALSESCWKALEAAFRAGRQANESESWDSRGTSIRGERLVTKQLTQHTPRREWTKAAMILIREDPKVKARAVAEHLRASTVCDFEEWGDDIEFLEYGDGFDRDLGEQREPKIMTKSTFETAVSKLKRAAKKKV